MIQKAGTSKGVPAFNYTTVSYEKVLAVNFLLQAGLSHSKDE